MRYVGATLIGFVAALVTTVAWEAIRIALSIFRADSLAAGGTGGLGAVSIDIANLRVPLAIGFVLGFVGFVVAVKRR